MTQEKIKNITRIVLPVLIIIAGVVFARYLYASKQKIKKARPQMPAPLVETMAAVKGPHQIVVTAMGTVQPSQEIALRAQVSGEVLSVADEFLPGGIFKKGDVILTLDDEDFRLVAKQRAGSVTSAKAKLALEMGQQEVAREDLALMQAASGRKIKNTALALREPQMNQTMAELEIAKANLEQARLNLKRSVIRAPFNCMIIERHVNKGSQVGTQDTLATLVGTDSYWVEATLPVGKLGSITIPRGRDGKGSAVKITTSNRAEYTGEVIRLLGDMNTQSRMARVLIRVNDPLGLQSQIKTAQLLLGSYVTVGITGNTLENVVPVPRDALKNGNEVWIAQNRKLTIRNVNPIWKSDSTIYIDGEIEAGEAIVTSELAAPVDGMAIRMNGAKTLKITERDKTRRPDKKRETPASKL